MAGARTVRVVSVNRTEPWLPDLGVVVFGDGRLPEILLTCLQFRLAADLARAGRLSPAHAIQLVRHIGSDRCLGCRAYYIARRAGRGAVRPPTGDPTG